MLNWFLNLELWKKILLIIAILVIIASCIFLVCLFLPKYTGPQENCVFLGEKANLHNEYYITVMDFYDCSSVEVIKNKDDVDKTELIGTDTHFIAVVILIEHINVKNPKENHPLDRDDFIIKDHTGIQIKNIYLFSKENGLALENKNFQTTKAQMDYAWIGSTINVGEKSILTLYFEVPKNISTLDTTIVLETDFFVGRTNKKAGTDIVLAVRKSK